MTTRNCPPDCLSRLRAEFTAASGQLRPRVGVSAVAALPLSRRNRSVLDLTHPPKSRASRQLAARSVPSGCAREPVWTEPVPVSNLTEGRGPQNGERFAKGRWSYITECGGPKELSAAAAVKCAHTLLLQVVSRDDKRRIEHDRKPAGDDTVRPLEVFRRPESFIKAVLPPYGGAPRRGVIRESPHRIGERSCGREKQNVMQG